MRHEADDPSHDTDHYDMTSAATVIGLFTECFCMVFNLMPIWRTLNFLDLGGLKIKLKTLLSDSRFEMPEPSCRQINFETQMIQTGRSISDTTTYVICEF